MSETDLTSMGTTLLVWAHPDDETYLSGGLAASRWTRGHRVVTVTATRGELAGRTRRRRHARRRRSSARRSWRLPWRSWVSPSTTGSATRTAAAPIDPEPAVRDWPA